MAKRANGVCEFVRVGDVMTWTYGDGIADVRYDMASNPDYANMSAFSQAVYANGAKQKIADSMAGPTGMTFTAKADCARAIADNLTQLVYNGERVDLLFEAMCLTTTKLPADVKRILDSLSPKEKSALARDPSVVAITNKLALERAKKSGISAATILERFSGKK